MKKMMICVLVCVVASATNVAAYVNSGSDQNLASGCVMGIFAFLCGLAAFADRKRAN